MPNAPRPRARGLAARALLALLLPLGAAAAGCTGEPDVKLGSEQPVKEDLASLVKRADAAFVERHVEAKLREAYALYEQAYTLSPDDRHILERLGFCAYHIADAFTEEKKQREEVHARGRAYGLAYMKLNPEWKKVLDSGGDIPEAVKHATKQEAEVLYYLGINWGRWGELYGIVRAAFDIPRVRAIYERVQALDPTYEGWGADRTLAIFYQKIPAMSGGSNKTAKEHWDVALKSAPEFLENKALYCEYYVKDVSEDKAEFLRLLNEVLAAPDRDGDPNRLQNLRAKRRAKDLLAQVDEIF